VDTASPLLNVAPTSLEQAKAPNLQGSRGSWVVRMASPARLVVFAGLPGVGKSTLAKALAERWGAVWLRVDTVEAAILKSGLKQSYESGLAAYIAVRDIAAEQLRSGRSVVIDAVNAVEEAREMWRELSGELHVPRYTIQVTCSDVSEHRRRVESRSPHTPPLPLPTWEEVVHREYLPWHEPVLSIEGTDPPQQSLERILDYCSETSR
jgi:predicted kinase